MSWRNHDAGPYCLGLLPSLCYCWRLCIVHVYFQIYDCSVQMLRRLLAPNRAAHGNEPCKGPGAVCFAVLSGRAGLASLQARANVRLDLSTLLSAAERDLRTFSIRCSARFEAMVLAISNGAEVPEEEIDQVLRRQTI